MRFLSFALRYTVMVLLAASLMAPARTAAQSAASAPAASSSAAASAQETKKSDEEQEQAFLHAPIVEKIGHSIGLSVDATSRLFLIINFAIIFFGIVIPLFKIVPKMLRKRSQTLRLDLHTARDATADAKSRLSAVEAKLAGLGEEMKKLRDQVEQESLQDEKRIKASIGEESARIVSAAEQEITAAAAQARRGLRNFAADLAIEHAEKQIKLTPETDRALIAEFVSDMAADGAARGGKS